MSGMIAFTPQQQKTIRSPGNVAVVAGAGSGKTSTLVERCVAAVLDETQPVGLDEILMVTFTDASATEMRKRIRERLAEEQKSRTGDERLEEQLALLDTAHIGTLHSFCLELVRQHFHELGLDPQITVLDERQTRPLEVAALERVLGRHYAGESVADQAVQSLIREQGNGSDEHLRRIVLKVHRFTQTLADPAAWMAQQVAGFSEAEPARWRRWLMEGFIDWKNLWLPALEALEPTPNIKACVNALGRAATNPDWDAIRETVDRIGEAKEAEWPSGAKTTVRDAIREFFEDAEFLRSLVDHGDDADPIAEDWQCVRQPMLTLLALAQEFTAEFTRAKRDLGGIDFADLEQLALRALRDPRTGRPTPAATTWQQQLRHVFVDEYQDINAAQDAIITLLSRPGPEGNRFLVGDVKQSIYRFRLANPRIFRDYELRWSGRSGEGRCLPLSENFRSRESLLEFINSLFRALMRPAIGGLPYDEAAQLRFGQSEGRAQLSLKSARGLGGHASPCVEFHLLPKPGALAEEEESDDPADGSDTADLDPVEQEARLIAGRLSQLREEKHLVWKQGRFEPVDWRDMVVLLRSAESRAERFAREFNLAGVPLLASRTGFYTALEVMDLLNLLRLLDNPLQDVALLGVLRSPLVGLTVDELAQIRLQSRAKPFWIALQQARHILTQTSPNAGSSSIGAQVNHPALGVDSFLIAFERWRSLARHLPLSHCLETILNETHYQAMLLAGERGRERAANVRRLISLAQQYDPYQRQGLFRFLRFVAAQEEAELDEEPAAAPAENAVRLMTIHKSKGLEWPVVVVAGLGAQFNFRDLNEDILLEEEFGLCPRVKWPGSDQVYPSPAHWLAARRAKREVLGEELRLLYVAATRARDTLILAGTARKKGDDAPCVERVAVTDRALATARCYLDWMRLWLPHAAGPANQREGSNELLRWKIYDPRDPIFTSPAIRPTAPGADESDQPPARTELSALRTRLEWRYPNAAATCEPAKTSVSALRRRLRDETDDEAKPAFRASSFGLQIGSRARAARDRLSAAEVGTAHHTFLQMVSLDHVGSVRELEAQAQGLRDGAVLSGEEIAALDFEAVAAFWQSNQGQQILARQSHVHREVPFTARFSPEDLAQLNLLGHSAAELRGEFFVVQGFVDLAVILPEELWLVDFKTDDARGPELEAKREDYERQLKLYGLALRRIYRRPVTTLWLHFLASRITFATGSS